MPIEREICQKDAENRDHGIGLHIRKGRTMRNYFNCGPGSGYFVYQVDEVPDKISTKDGWIPDLEEQCLNIR